jgi:hypothetical protein
MRIWVLIFAGNRICNVYFLGVADLAQNQYSQHIFFEKHRINAVFFSEHVLRILVLGLSDFREGVRKNLSSAYSRFRFC